MGSATGDPSSGSGTLARNDSVTMEKLERTDTVRTVARGLIKLRGVSDDLPQRWWFVSTAIPLLAATTGPLSNVLSIAALVTPWRMTLPNNGDLPDGADYNGTGIPDPHWEIILNALSLACGFAGNLFLLLNFTGRVRYIISLPLSIFFWVLASGILVAITISINIYEPPIAPGEIYSQGFWHAVLAAVLYVAGSLMMGANMLGYFRGHYPQKFDLDDDQRTLILQTMMFFFWLAAGAGVFVALEGWTYADALYYCEVSVLTIGFGDFYPKTDNGRGFLFFFVIVGIIFIGLVISSISRFAANISADKIIKTHKRHARESTVGRTVTTEAELRERLGLPPRRESTASTVDTAGTAARARRESLDKYGRLEIVGRTVTFTEKKAVQRGGRGGAGRSAPKKRPGGKAMSRDEKMMARKHGSTTQERRHQRRQKLVLLQEEKDRFDAMREIQDETQHWKQYWALLMAVLAFGILWCLGALVFMVSEARLQGLTYFQTLYFCFVSLLTIGYGDMSPKSNVGKPFFIVWSLIAVPIVTVLIQEMASTIVAAVNRGTFALADWTVMPKEGLTASFLAQHPNLRDGVARFVEKRAQKKRLDRGFELQDPDGPSAPDGDDPEKQMSPTTTRDYALQAEREVEAEIEETEHDLARQVAASIKTVAQDLRASPPKKYSYEQWMHFKKLIVFSRRTLEEIQLLREGETLEDDGLVEWDWIGENSPMLADITEAEWVLERLCESLNRYTRKQGGKSKLKLVSRFFGPSSGGRMSKKAILADEIDPMAIPEDDLDLKERKGESSTGSSSKTSEGVGEVEVTKL